MSKTHAVTVSNCKSMSDSDSVAEQVPSPCVAICALDEDDVCVGCFRTGREISYWGRLSVQQQREVLRRCQLRMNGAQAACVMEKQ